MTEDDSCCKWARYGLEDQKTNVSLQKGGPLSGRTLIQATHFDRKYKIFRLFSFQSVLNFWGGKGKQANYFQLHFVLPSLNNKRKEQSTNNIQFWKLTQTAQVICKSQNQFSKPIGGGGGTFHINFLSWIAVSKLNKRLFCSKTIGPLPSIKKSD